MNNDKTEKKKSENVNIGLKNKDLVKYLKTVDPEAEVTVFDGYRSRSIKDIMDTEIHLNK